MIIRVDCIKCFYTKLQYSDLTILPYISALIHSLQLLILQLGNSKGSIASNDSIILYKGKSITLYTGKLIITSQETSSALI